MQLKDTQQFTVSVEGRDKKGKVAKFENPTFTVSDPAIGTFTPDPSDPAGGTFAAGDPGTCQLAFQADGIVGEGESVIAASLDIEVLPGDAVDAVINVGPVTEQV